MAIARTWTELTGFIARGHGVASGSGNDPRFPEGTIRPQLPFFADRVPDLWAHIGGPPHPATINLRVPGACLAVGAPEFRLAGIRWTALFPPEDFYLSRAELTVRGRTHPVMLYLPDPETKPDHHQPPDTIELLAEYVPGIAYGDPAALHFPATALSVRAG